MDNASKEVGGGSALQSHQVAVSAHSRQRAGKGAKKASPRPAGLRATEVKTVRLDAINRGDSRFQYRLNGHVANLKASLQREGQREPVDLTASEPHLVIDGYRRVQAIGELGWDTVHALVHEVDEAEAHRIAFLKNVVRRNLSPLEKANAIRLAKQRGRKDLAAEFGLSTKQVARYEALLDLPKPLQQLVDKGEMSMTHAKVLADSDLEDGTPWLDMIRQDKLSAVELRRRVRTAMGKKKPGRKKLYLKQSKEGFRMYPFTISKDSPKAERDQVVKLLKEVIASLTD